MDAIRTDSTQYVTVTFATTDDLTAATFRVSFDDGDTWWPADNVAGAARILVGPGGVVQLVAGTYTVVAEIADTPEVEVIRAGSLLTVVDPDAIGTDGWASPDDVTTYTGAVVESGTVNLAQSIVETFVNRTPDAAAGFTVRDLGHLRKAVAFQAAWLAGQPGVLSRMGATSVQQDGLSTTFTNPADMTLAPLAQRAIRNLSWMGTRTIRRRVYDRAGTAGMTAGTWLTVDPETGWEAL